MIYRRHAGLMALRWRSRHTVTRETSWTLPQPAHAALETAPQEQQHACAPTSAAAEPSSQAAVSQEAMLSRLLDAVQADATGMLFAETARSLRLTALCFELMTLRSMATDLLSRQ